MCLEIVIDIYFKFQNIVLSYNCTKQYAMWRQWGKKMIVMLL